MGRCRVRVLREQKLEFAFRRRILAREEVTLREREPEFDVVRLSLSGQFQLRRGVRITPATVVTHPQQCTRLETAAVGTYCFFECSRGLGKPLGLEVSQSQVEI